MARTLPIPHSMYGGQKPVVYLPGMAIQRDAVLRHAYNAGGGASRLTRRQRVITQATTARGPQPRGRARCLEPAPSEPPELPPSTMVMSVSPRVRPKQSLTLYVGRAKYPELRVCRLGVLRQFPLVPMPDSDCPCTLPMFEALRCSSPLLVILAHSCNSASLRSKLMVLMRMADAPV